MCVRMFAREGMQMRVCMCVLVHRRPEDILKCHSSGASHSVCLFVLKQVLSTGPRLAKEVGLTDQQAPGLFFSLPS